MVWDQSLNYTLSWVIVQFDTFTDDVKNNIFIKFPFQSGSKRIITEKNSSYPWKVGAPLFLAKHWDSPVAINPSQRKIPVTHETLGLPCSSRNVGAPLLQLIHPKEKFQLLMKSCGAPVAINPSQRKIPVTHEKLGLPCYN